MSILNKYIWVVDTLHQAGERGISLKELNEKWVRNETLSCGEPIPRQTFDRWKGNILDLLGVIIECHTKGGYRYYIENPEILSDCKLSRWLLDTYSTVNALSKHASLYNRILVEEIPSNRDFLAFIINAMKDNTVVVLTYKNFITEKELSFPICPYCLKMFQKRWYTLALSVHENKLRIYALDRIVNAQLTEQHFNLPKDFDAKEYFSSYFGIVLDETVKEQRIILRAYKPHQNYLRTLPLHPSQKEIYTCDTYADYELSLRPTYDFAMELLHAGALVEVLEPESLRKQMYSWVKDLWNMYKNI
ncbi:WYL domain-containing protein [Bacteroides sp. ET489]|uniref:helix-turn-helix transcriptional regulator n=1 Tax=Bacteroides sp. ET489 TaxID=3057126 RepID=UPI0026739E8F|nr:WYL domain-containing protein [Bacteroides sp. ET489]MDO3391423.1 WYL domain-containing protein [Bacteroides sp. ET489]